MEIISFFIRLATKIYQFKIKIYTYTFDANVKEISPEKLPWKKNCRRRWYRIRSERKRFERSYQDPKIGRRKKVSVATELITIRENRTIQQAFLRRRFRKCHRPLKRKIVYRCRRCRAFLRNEDSNHEHATHLRKDENSRWEDRENVSRCLSQWLDRSRNCWANFIFR